MPLEKPYDCVILVGDLNYRLNGDKSAIFEAMKQNMYTDLLYND
jgi:hypothetical protein